MLRAGDDVELHDAVVLVFRLLGRRIALALLGADVNQDRPVLGVPHVGQHGNELFEVVAVDDADIIESEFLEQRAAGDKAARQFFRQRRLVAEEARQMFGHLLAEIAQ